MVTISTLSVRLQAQTGPFDRGLEQTRRIINQTQNDFNRMNSAAGGIQSSIPAFGSVTNAISGVASAAMKAAAAVAAIGAAGVGYGIKLAADAEQAEIAFTTMLGSADLAKKTLAGLVKFAAETPFELPEIRSAGRSLLAFGVEAKDLIPTLTAIGDVSAGISAPINEIAEVYGKARVQGRLFAEDINQLTGRGIPVIGQLAKQFGVAEEGVRKLVETGQVRFKHLEKAFIALTTGGGKFAGLMAAQSQSLTGLWSTFKDDFKAVLTEVGDSFIQAFDLKDVLKDSSAFIKGLLPTIKALAPEFIAQGKLMAGEITALTKSIAKGIADIGPELMFLGHLSITFVTELAKATDEIIRMEGAFGKAAKAAGILINPGAFIGPIGVDLFQPGLGGGTPEGARDASPRNRRGGVVTGADPINPEVIPNFDSLFVSVKEGLSETFDSVFTKLEPSFANIAKSGEEFWKSMEKNIQSLQSQADKIKQSIKTPFQLMADEINNINKLAQLGFLNQAEATLAKQNVIDKYATEKATTTPFVSAGAAVKLGSEEWINELQKHRSGTGKDPTADNTKRTADGIDTLIKIVIDNNGLLPIIRPGKF